MSESQELQHQPKIYPRKGTKRKDVTKTPMPKKTFQTHVITDREELKNHIHRIHDFLRNHGIALGMTALEVFNLFYGLKLIDKKRDKFDPPLPEVCSWENIKNLGANDILPTFCGRNEAGGTVETSNVLDELFENKKTKTIFHDIPRDVQGDTYVELIKMIDKIPVSDQYDVDLAGKIYEYFIGFSDKTSQSSMGAYFTDRHITTFIINELKPQLREDNQIPTFIDMFGGSGGFTLMYTRYMNDNYGHDIDWKTQIKRIHHFDLSEIVIKSAALEMFVLTDQLPDITKGEHFRRCNTFKNDWGNMKYDYVISNPPYGGDSEKSSEIKEIDKLVSQLKGKYSKYKWANAQLAELAKKKKDLLTDIKKEKVNIDTCNDTLQTYAYECGILDKMNDKEACSLLLFMKLVAENGVAAGVLKEGVFFDSKYTDIRKVLLNKFNVKQVISVPADQFENTTTKTSIIIFENTGRTEKIEFSDLIVLKQTEDEFEILDNRLRVVRQRDEITGVRKKHVCYATYDDIIGLEIKGKCQYTLDSKAYVNSRRVYECDDKYEMKKLGDIVEFMPKSKRKAAYGVSEGKYNFYTSSDNIKKCDVADYKENIIVVGDGGMGSIYIDDMFSCSDHNHLITSKNAIKNFFFYACLIVKRVELFENMTGSTIKNLSKNKLSEFQIPIPKDKALLDEWVTKISTPYDAINAKKKELKTLEEDIKSEVQRICDEEECDMVKLGDIAAINPKATIIDSDTVEYLDTGNAITFSTKKLMNDGNLPSRAKKTVEIEDILISSVRPKNKNINIVTKNTYKKNLLVSTGFFVIRCKKYSKYIYMNFNRDLITDFLHANSVGSGYPAVQHKTIENLQIPIPKNKTLIEALNPKFDKIDTLQQEIKEEEIKYKTALNELAEDVKKKVNQTDEQPIEESLNSVEHAIELKPVKIITKKSKAKTKTESNTDSDDSPPAKAKPKRIAKAVLKSSLTKK